MTHKQEPPNGEADSHDAMWISSVDRHAGTNAEHVSAAEYLLTFVDHVIPAAVANGDLVQDLVRLGFVELKEAQDKGGYEYRTIIIHVDQRGTWTLP